MERRKVVMLICLVVIAFGIGIPSYHYYQNYQKEQELNEKLQKSLGKDQGMTELILRNIQGTVTYGELFESCEKSVKDRSDIIIDLRGLYPNMDNELRDSLADFLDMENELMRLMSLSARKEMERNSISDEPRRQYTSDYYNYDSNPDKYTRLSEAEEKMYNYNDGVNIKYNLLIQMEKDLSLVMKKFNMRFVLIYPKYVDILENQFPTKKQHEEALKKQIQEFITYETKQKEVVDSIKRIHLKEKREKEEKQLSIEREVRKRRIKKDNHGITQDF